MIIEVDGVEAHGSTGGVDPAGEGPAIVLVHGAGMDATVWQLQTRYLAGRGCRAVAVDLPCHGATAGHPMASIDDMAAWLGRFVDALGWGPVTLVGHSMGSFVVLELAATRPELAASLVLLGAATSMPVHPELLERAKHDVAGAAALMASWGHGPAAHIGLNPTPGMWMLGGQRALVERSRPGALFADLKACAAYDGAAEAAASLSVRTTVVIGDSDKMTPPKGGRALAGLIEGSTVIELEDIGHDPMFESPRATREAILLT